MNQEAENLSKSSILGVTFFRHRYHLALRNQADVAVKKEMLFEFKTCKGFEGVYFFSAEGT